jgi:hypothetical protein
MKSLHYVLALALALVCVTPVFAGDWQYKESGFAFWIPDDWEHEWDGEGNVFTAWDDTDKGPQFEFYAPTMAKLVETSIEGLDQELEQWLHDIKIGEPETTTVNGLSVTFVDGTGNLDKQSRYFSADAEICFGVAIYTKGNKSFMVFGFIESQYLEEYQTAIRKVLHSVKLAD